MNIFFSETQDAGDISFSCQDSMFMWRHDGNDEVCFEDENVTVYKDCSYDSWNGRFGVIIKSKHDDTVITMHYTGKGLGWGEITSSMTKGNLLFIPDEMAQEGRSVYDAVMSSQEWERYSHVFFYGLQGDLPKPMPMVPFPVG